MEHQNREEGLERLKLEFEGIPENEEFARVVTAVFMSRLNPTLEEVEDVKIAVSEAVTNAVVHGYGEKGGRIRMELKAQKAPEKKLVLSVEDWGKGIADVKKAMEPMFTTDTSGERSGMGFTIMESFMDSVSVRSKPGRGTTVVMRRELSARAVK